MIAVCWQNIRHETVSAGKGGRPYGRAGGNDTSYSEPVFRDTTYLAQHQPTKTASTRLD